MPQIINESSIGGNLGSAFGTGLGQGLQMLAQTKLQKLIQDKENQKNALFWKSAGLPDDLAVAFGSAPKELQKSLLDRLEGLEFGGAPTQAQQQLVKPLDQQQNNFEQPQTQALDSLGQPSDQKPNIHEVMNLLYGNNQQNAPFIEQQAPITSSKELKSEEGIAPKPGTLKLGPTKEERRHREILDQKERLAAYKETKDIRHNIVEKANAARQDLKDLDRLEELQKDNKLDTPGYVEFLQRSGFDIPALMNPESEEFQKIQQSFIKNAKQVFGGRISNYEVEQFLKTIPSLSQSPEGRKRVIANLKYVARASLEHNNALKEVVAENKGIPPLDLEEQIFEKTEKKMDALSKKFKEDLAKPVPKGQNKLITALQAGLGSAVGGIGSAIKTVGGLASGLGAASKISKLI